MTKGSPLRVPPTDYKKRVKAIKNSLPRAYRKIVFQHYPEYNSSDQNRRLLNSVMNLRTADVRLTEILESIALGELKLIE